MVSTIAATRKARVKYHHCILYKDKLAEPIGAAWEYSSSSQNMHEKARLNIFGWGSAIRTSLRDMARIGWLCCNWGNWDGHQVIPEAWVRETIPRRSRHSRQQSGGNLALRSRFLDQRTRQALARPAARKFHFLGRRRPIRHRLPQPRLSRGDEPHPFFRSEPTLRDAYRNLAAATRSLAPHPRRLLTE